MARFSLIRVLVIFLLAPTAQFNDVITLRTSDDATEPTDAEDRLELCLSQDFAEIEDIDTVETSILLSVMMNYDYRLRPGMNKRTLDVDVSIWVYNIGPISETSMNFRTDFYFTQSWIDKRLDFSQAVCNQTNVTFTMTNDQDIWMPDTYFPNALEAGTHSVTQENKAIWLRSDGRVTTSSRVTIVSRCPMEFRYFPMDIQSCDLRFLSYGYQQRDLAMKWNQHHPIEIEKDVTIAQFTLLQKKINETTLTFHHGSYSCLVVTFIFQRNVGYYLIQTIIPSVLCVSLSWVSFFIKRDATPARASLGITTVLAVVTLIASDSWSLPRISVIKAIEVYLFACLLFVVGALTEFSLVCYFSKPRFDIKSDEFDNDHFMETPMTERMLPTEEPDDHAGGETGNAKGPNGMLNGTKPTRHQFAGFDVGRIDVFSRFAFPASFLFFNIIYWAFYLTITSREASRHMATDKQIDAL